MYFFLCFGFLYLLLVFLMFVSIFYGSFVFSFTFFSVGGVDLSFSFLFDYVSLGFFASVSFISSMVFFYSVFYMAGTVDVRRFSWLVFGFVLSMGLLVFSGSFLSLMVGWDGLGLISFCLVIFYSNYSSLESGLVTVFSNRVGDVFFLGCFLILFSGSAGLSDAFSFLDVLLFSFLFLGAITKSAQFPFSAWLPAAMAAPTPVSSLVHSSTLVTAGVYVLLRFHYLFFSFQEPFMKLFFILTMFLAGACACLETDFKKIVAMSTLSQLGLMLFVLSVGVWFLTYLHMIIHAFFKSLLFMSTGSLMHNFMGGQDSRVYGGDSFSFGSWLCFFVSCACLMGFPFFIGFYSKDLIILGSSFGLGILFYVIFMAGCFLTVSYSFRLLKSSFLGLFSGLSHLSYGDSKIFMASVCFLALKSFLLGGLFFSLFFYDSAVSFMGFDLIVGLFLILCVFLFYGFFNLFYYRAFYIYSIGFLRWFSSSGSSSVASGLRFYRWDASWMEAAGGQGVYWFLQSFCGFDFYKFLGVSVFFFVFFGIFFF
uniref:NADH-ubiquinone oxidoreductase chain 5 n=1 Tax=Paraleius leontonychus TaxID=1807943 RepID=A0A330JG25_9ACAR|nr:NADH dehydrogenase subunit 5 [Paraleius leontonychus]